MGPCTISWAAVACLTTSAWLAELLTESTHVFFGFENCAWRQGIKLLFYSNQLQTLWTKCGLEDNGQHQGRCRLNPRSCLVHDWKDALEQFLSVWANRRVQYVGLVAQILTLLPGKVRKRKLKLGLSARVRVYTVFLSGKMHSVRTERLPKRLTRKVQ